MACVLDVFLPHLAREVEEREGQVVSPFKTGSRSGTHVPDQGMGGCYVSV